MAILIGLFLLAALPLLLVFVFFEIKAKQQHGEWKDKLQQLAVASAWILLGLVGLWFLYEMMFGDHYRRANPLRFIWMAADFLSRI